MPVVVILWVVAGIFIVPVLRALHLQSGQWYLEAVSLLAAFEGPEATLGLIAALDAAMGRYLTDFIQPAVVQRLLKVEPADRQWLTFEPRKGLIQRLNKGELAWEYVNNTQAPLLEAICKACATVGAVEAIPLLKKLLEHRVYVPAQRRLHEAARQALDILEPIAERQKPGEKLLRPADTETETLLRPHAGGSRDENLLQPVNARNSEEFS